MIDLPVVSAVSQDEGRIETFHLSLVNPAGPPTVELRNIADRGGIVEQVQYARATAHHFLSQPYVQPIVAHDLEKGTLVIEAEEPGVYRDRSFGLSFLAGCLAIGLDARLRPGRVFSASLSGVFGGVGGVELGPVGRLTAKLAAACIERQAVLLCRCSDEDEVIQFEEAYWRGDASFGCLPRLLPETISTAAVVAMALDTAAWLADRYRLEAAAVFPLLLFWAAGELPDGMGFPHGIGSAMAYLRSRGRLAQVQGLSELSRHLQMPQITNGEHFIARSLDRVVQGCWDDETRSEVIVASIASCDGSRSAGENRQDAEVDDSNLPQQVFEGWLEDAATHPPELFFALTVIDASSRLIADFDAYRAKAGALVLRGLESLFENVAELVARGNYSRACTLLEALLQRRLPDRLGRTHPELVTEAIRLWDQRIGSLNCAGDKALSEAVAALGTQLSLHNAPAQLRPLLVKPEERLLLSFRLVEGPIRCQPPHPHRPLPCTNELEVEITGPRGASIRVPSPVLLLEAAEREPSYCRRDGFALADATLSRYPFEDARVVSECFSGVGIPNFIGFLANSQGPCAAVQWHPVVNPWPPAIDTQLMVAAMLQNRLQSKPCRLLDVGCGTGYLAVAAAHIWPSLQELHLLDVDPLSVLGAGLNVRNDPVSCTKRIKLHRKSFHRFTGEHFDTLLCNPPYLPDRPLPPNRIELATNNTDLLEEVVLRGPFMATEIWLVFSVLAWHEFRSALMRAKSAYSRIELLRRDIVPLRIPWLSPGDGDPQHDAKDRYFRNVLAPRGLIDLNANHSSWQDYLKRTTPRLPEGVTAEFRDHADALKLEERLDLIAGDSRGFRFWHEVRVLRLISAANS